MQNVQSGKRQGKKISQAIAAASLLAASSMVSAATLYWDADADSTGNTTTTNIGGSGTWDTAALNWWDGVSADVAWPNTNLDVAVFTGAAGQVTLSGALIANSLTFNTNGYTLSGGTNLTLSGTNPTINVAAGQVATINSVIAGSTRNYLSGGGTLALGGANTTSGGWSITAGTLQLNSATAWGTSGSVIIANTAGTAALDLNGQTVTSASRLNFSGAGTHQLINSNTTSKAVINPGGGAQVFTGNVATNWQIGGAGDIDFNAGFNGGGQTVTKIGTGAVTFTSGGVQGFGSNNTAVLQGTLIVANSSGSFTDYLTIASGALVRAAMTGGGALVWTGHATGVINNGTIDLNARTVSIGRLAGTGVVDNSSTITPATLQLTGSTAATTFGGVIQNTGSAVGVIMNANTTHTFTGNNTYSGGTTISQGTLQIGNGGATGSVGSGNVLNNGTLSSVRSGSQTLANTISGTGNLIMGSLANTASTLTLTANNTYAGTTTVNYSNTGTSLTTLQVGAGGTSGSLGTGTVSLANYAVLNFNRSDSTTVANAINGNGHSNNQLLVTGGGTVTYTGTISSASVIGRVFVDNGTLVLDNNAVINTAAGGSGAYTSIARSFNNTGTLTLKGNSIYNANADFNVGDNALTTSGLSNAMLNIQDSATLNFGSSTTNAGIIVGSAFTGTGYNATGVVNQTGGSATLNHASSTFILGGRNSGSTAGSGTWNLSGGTLSLKNFADIGRYGTGRLNISGGAMTIASYSSIGSQTSGNGAVSITAGSLQQSGSAFVGEQGAGSLFISGGTFSSGGLVLGNGNAGNKTPVGTMTVNGGTVTVNTAKMLLGNFGTGVLNLNGGLMSVSGEIAIGEQNGGASPNTFGGTLNLNGGVLETRQIRRGSAGNDNMLIRVNFNGGVLRANSNQTEFMRYVNQTYVRDGGAIVDSNGYNVTISQALVHSPLGGDAAVDGGLTKRGAGVLTLGVNGFNNTYNGATVVQGGTLNIANTVAIDDSARIVVGDSFANNAAVLNVATAGGYTVGAAQALGGHGSVSGSLTVNGTVDAGHNGIGTLSSNNLTMTSGANLAADVDLDNSAADQVNVVGTINFGGSNLVLTLTPTNSVFSPNSQTLVLLNNDNADAVVGSFAGLTRGGANDSADFTTDNLAFTVYYSYDAVNSTFTGGNDVAVTFSAVPEPASLSLLALGGAAMLKRRRRQQ